MLLLAEEKILLVHPHPLHDCSSECVSMLIGFALSMLSANNCFSWQHVVFPTIVTLPASMIGEVPTIVTRDDEKSVKKASMHPPRLSPPPPPPFLELQTLHRARDYLKDLQNQEEFSKLSFGSFTPGIRPQVRVAETRNDHDSDDDEGEDEVVTMLSMPFPYLCGCSLNLPRYQVHRRHHVLGDCDGQYPRHGFGTYTPLICFQPMILVPNLLQYCLVSFRSSLHAASTAFSDQPITVDK